MASIEISNDQLTVRMSGIDRVLAFRSSVTVPLAHVEAVRAYPREGDFDAAVYDPSLGTGLFFGGKMAIGTVVLPDGPSFYEVRDKERTIAIDLRGEDYRHLVVELDDEDPDRARARVERALAEFRVRDQAKTEGTEATPSRPD